MFVTVSEKKNFIVWLVNNVSFNQREVLWILNYLVNHEAILTNVHFVEKAEKTPRGIIVTSREKGSEDVRLFIEGHMFTDPEQVFHELRLNWKKTLYLECLFEHAWQNDQYLCVLEDNPYARWNEQVSEAITTSIDQYFKQQETQQKLTLLYQQIDLALEDNDYEAFLKLSDELNHLKRTV